MFVTVSLVITFAAGFYVYSNTTKFDYEARVLAKISMSLGALAYILQSLHNFN